MLALPFVVVLVLSSVTVQAQAPTPVWTTFVGTEKQESGSRLAVSRNGIVASVSYTHLTLPTNREV